MATSDKLPDFDLLWDYNQPEETERRFRDLLPLAESGGDLSYRIQLLTQIARTEGLQRKFDAAHRTLDAAQALLTGDLAQGRIRYLLERGRVFNSSKQPAQAQPLFLAAWELAIAQQEDFYAVDAAHMLGIIEPPEQQLEWNLKALERAEQAADARARKWRGSLYNNIGWTYFGQGQHQQALEIFQKALACREAEGRDREIRIARWCIAKTLRVLHRFEEALEIQQELLTQLDDSGETDGYVHEELAECLLALERKEAAQQHFALAYAMLSEDPWLIEDEPARISRLKALGQA